MNRQLIVIPAIFGTAETEAFELPRVDQNLFGRIIRNPQPAGRSPKDREWWRQVRPWLRQLSNILKFVPKLSDLAKAYDEQRYKSNDLSVEIYDAAAEAFPEFAPQAERSARRELDVVMGKEVEAEGTALRAARLLARGGQDPALVRPQARGHQRRQHPVAVR